MTPGSILMAQSFDRTGASRAAIGGGPRSLSVPPAGPARCARNALMRTLETPMTDRDLMPRGCGAREWSYAPKPMEVAFGRSFVRRVVRRC